MQREVEVRGHLIDSMILTRIFDRIMDLNGEFEVLEFKIGKEKADYSYAKLLVKGKNPKHLQTVLEEVYREGAIPVKLQSANFKASPKDMVLPDDFYSTTNHQTFVLVDSDWIEVQNQMMDKVIVVDLAKKKAWCKPIREIRKGDMIVVGDAGVRIVPPERPREGMDVFQFMSSHTSTEKPIQALAKRIADDMFETKNKRWNIVVVGGPAVVHTGASKSLADLIRMGYVDALLAGNAIATHDIEYALFGTSLGIDVDNGITRYKGHRNHMAAINEVFKAGSIAGLVKNGKLKRGIMYECVKNKVPFVLAASIRDDGPIPDVVSDMAEAQRLYKEQLRDAKMVLMLSTMLHSVAVGNMLPSSVKVVAIDINPATVTKLLDRGTGQAVGVVSDIGVFLPMIVSYLKELESKD
jgi:lysine-ketoglutarate reductase/saccharopine dehydrogenase-like protein (TIGR00300 family)